MTEECPTTNMTCVLTLLAEMQACADQLVGAAEAFPRGELPTPVQKVLDYQIKVARFLQASIDRYEEQHGDTDASFKVRAARALRQALVA